jgi:toxin secretion/phage lysis holin
MKDVNLFNKVFHYLNYIVGAIGGYIGYALGGYDQALVILIGMVFADYITGLLSAYLTKKLNSDIGRQGIVKKIGIFLVVAIAYMTDTILGAEGLIRMMSIWFYISKEGISALENLAESGVPIPEKLKNALQQLHEQSEDKNTEEELT